MKRNRILKQLTLGIATLFMACEQDSATFTTEFEEIGSNNANGARAEYLTAEELPKTIELLRKMSGTENSKFGEDDAFIETDFGNV